MTYATPPQKSVLSLIVLALSTLMFAGVLVSTTGVFDPAIEVTTGERLVRSADAVRIDRVLQKSAAPTSDQTIPVAPPLSVDDDLLSVFPPSPPLLADGELPQPAPVQTDVDTAPAVLITQTERGGRNVDAEAQPTPAVDASSPEPTPADVEKTPAVAGPRTAAQRGQAAFDSLGFDIGSLGYSIVFHDQKQGFLGLTFTDAQIIEIYVRPEVSDRQLAFVIAHEIGHAVDHVRNNAAGRAEWRSARGMAVRAPWWPNGSAADWDTPAGDFAECFAVWLTGTRSSHAQTPCTGTGDLVERVVESRVDASTDTPAPPAADPVEVAATPAPADDLEDAVVDEDARMAQAIELGLDAPFEYVVSNSGS